MYDVKPNLIIGFHGCERHVRDALVAKAPIAHASSARLPKDQAIEIRVAAGDDSYP